MVAAILDTTVSKRLCSTASQVWKESEDSRDPSSTVCLFRVSPHTVQGVSTTKRHSFCFFNFRLAGKPTPQSPEPDSDRR